MFVAITACCLLDLSRYLYAVRVSVLLIDCALLFRLVLLFDCCRFFVPLVWLTL